MEASRIRQWCLQTTRQMVVRLNGYYLSPLGTLSWLGRPGPHCALYRDLRVSRTRGTWAARLFAVIGSRILCWFWRPPGSPVSTLAHFSSASWAGHGCAPQVDVIPLPNIATTFTGSELSDSTVRVNSLISPPTPPKGHNPESRHWCQYVPWILNIPVYAGVSMSADASTVLVGPVTCALICTSSSWSTISMKNIPEPLGIFADTTRGLSRVMVLWAEPRMSPPFQAGLKSSGGLASI